MVKIVLIFLLLNVAGAQVNKSLDLQKLSGEACFRDCRNSKPRVCYFHWHLEHYHSLGPACGTCGESFKGNVRDCFNEQCVTVDGIERGVMSINRKIPGPSIHVCVNDHIVVDVTNMMGGTSAAIHWHGFHQRKTPHMDGVPFITQCPIPFSTTFRYAFDATEAGTQFYHSHSGHHKVNGHHGGIVVRRSTKDDPNWNTYDHDEREHLIVISDWMKTDGEMFMPGLRSDPIGIQPSNLLINGKGTVRNPFNRRSKTGTPLEVFRVQRGQRYRFRFVNSMSHICPAQVEIENHSLLIIASDSFDLQPVAVDSFVSNSGERYDFVVNTNQSGDTFWIRVRALGSCATREIEQFAILSYKPSSIDSVELAYPQQPFPEYSLKFGIGRRSLNHPNTTCGNSDPENYCITDLSSYVERPDITDVPFNQRFYLGFRNFGQKVGDIFRKDNYGHFMNLRGDVVSVGAINKISFQFPDVPLLTQPEDVKEKMFCDEYSIPPNCTLEICTCVHRIKVKLDSVVELVVYDEALSVNIVNHPFHLHGYKLFVMDMGQHPDKIPMTYELAKTLTKFKRLGRVKSKKYPIKDTISIPSKGYTVFRFKADNPGFWLLHCHFEWHLAVGMGLVVQVGEPRDMVKPPENFPKCRNYQPEINANVFS